MKSILKNNKKLIYISFIVLLLVVVNLSATRYQAKFKSQAFKYSLKIANNYQEDYYFFISQKKDLEKGIKTKDKIPSKSGQVIRKNFIPIKDWCGAVDCAYLPNSDNHESNNINYINDTFEKSQYDFNVLKASELYVDFDRQVIYSDYYTDILKQFPSIQVIDEVTTDRNFLYKIKFSFASSKRLTQKELEELSKKLVVQENIYLYSLLSLKSETLNNMQDKYCGLENSEFTNNYEKNFDPSEIARDFSLGENIIKKSLLEKQYVSKKSCLETKILIKKEKKLIEKNTNALKIVNFVIELNDNHLKSRINNINLSIASIIFCLMLILIVEIIISSNSIKKIRIMK